MAPGFYKHENNRSVMIEVQKSFYVKEKKLYKVKARWWKYSTKVKYYYPINYEFERIEIKSADLKNWNKPQFVEGTL